MAIKMPWPIRTNETRFKRGDGQESKTELQLQRRDLYRVRGKRRGPAVTCLEGMIWITQAGDPRDHLLLAGDQFAVNRGGNVLVEAVREARVRVTT